MLEHFMPYALQGIVSTAAVIPGKKAWSNFPLCPVCNLGVGSMCGCVGDLCSEGYVFPWVLRFPPPPSLSLSHQMSTFVNLNLT